MAHRHTVDIGSLQRNASLGEEVPILKEGWLTKQGGFIKNWKKRWFVLQGTKLHYYEDNHKKDLKGTIDLEHTNVNINNNMGRGKEHCLEIVGPKRTYPLVADNAVELETWMNAILKGSLWQPGLQQQLVPQRVAAEEDIVFSFSIKGMVSACCETEVKKMLDGVGKIAYVLDYENETCKVKGKFDPATLTAMLEDAGYFIYPEA